MRLRGWLVVVVAASSCTEAPPPPPPPPQVVVAAPVKQAPVLPPEDPELIAAFPDEVALPEEADTDAALLKLLLADPLKAEAALHKLSSPTNWQVAVLAQFAIARGENTFELDAEPALPVLETDGGVSGPGPAWTSQDATPLLGLSKKKPPTLATLPIDTKVEVSAIDGDDAVVSVPLAQVAIFGEEGRLPARVTSTALVGRVPLSRLASKPPDPEALMLEALRQTEDAHAQLRAVALWEMAWRIERSERTRGGLLNAAWATRRASTVVRAAMARNLAPVSDLRFAWACNTEDPSRAKWLDLTKARPKKLPASSCVGGLDSRVSCGNDDEAEKKKAAATTAWLAGLGLAPKPWLRFTVDARDPRQVFLVTTPLEVADACSDFEELSFEAASGIVRRLTLPLGTKGLVVWVPVTRHLGAEFAVPSATTERQAVSWLRSRGRYRWTLEKGTLEPSLGMNATTFRVSAEVNATTFALPPERDCSCD
ncbi:MAG: hypothetical protein Q8L48_36400 [Archangium sp.]|nr:hypothetical protein [Archangium sp.]